MSSTPPSPRARPRPRGDEASRDEPEAAGQLEAAVARDAGGFARPSELDRRGVPRGAEPDNRSALERLRRNIRAAAPRAEECISYGIPAFRLDGRVLVWYGAAAKHCAFYPGGVVGELANELAGWDTGKGTVRFPPERPLPAALVKKIVRARIARDVRASAARAAANRGRRPRR